MSQGVEIKDSRWEAFDAAIEDNLRIWFNVAKKNEPLHRLGVVASLLAMLDSEQLGSKANKTLVEYDREARNVLVMRRVLLERQRKELMKETTVRETFVRSERSGRYKTFGHNDGIFKRFAQFLISDAFEREVTGLGAVEGAKRREVQIGRLASVSPEFAQEVACHWAAQQIEKNPINVLRRLPQAERERGLEALLTFLSKLPEGKNPMRGNVVPPSSKSPTLMAPASGLNAMLTTAAARKALARNLALMLHSDVLRNSIGHLDDVAMIARLKANNVAGADFLDMFTKTASAGRGVTTLFSMWGIFVVARNSAPLDDKGNIRWDQMRTNVHSLIGVTTTLPDVGKFCDLPVRFVMAKILSDEFRGGKVGNAACKATNFAAHSVKFKVFCESLGVIGDFFTLPFAIKALADECGNEDLVGTGAKIAGCISTAGGLALGLCAVAGMTVLPILVVGTAFLGIASAIVDSKFGQSALTGKIRKDLRYLGISDDEEAAHEELATEMRTVTRGYGAMYYGGTYTATEQTKISYSRVRTNAASVSFDKKLHLINYYLDRKTRAKEETLVLGIFDDTRRDSATFIRLVEATDPIVIADELQDSAEASRMMCWTARAYQALGRDPCPGLSEQLIEHCRQHRWKTIVAYLREVTGSNPELARSYGRISAETLKKCGINLMNGSTRSGEEWALSWLHVAASKEQLDALARLPGSSRHFERLRKEMKTADWKKLHARMRDKRADPYTHGIASQL